jgi:hypothetical protein
MTKAGRFLLLAVHTFNATVNYFQELRVNIAYLLRNINTTSENYERAGRNKELSCFSRYLIFVRYPRHQWSS